jgi:hypothetical protein
MMIQFEDDKNVIFQVCLAAARTFFPINFYFFIIMIQKCGVLNNIVKRIVPPAQSTYIYRAPQCMSHRRNWDSPNPSPASECALPPRPKGWGSTLACG